MNDYPHFQPLGKIEWAVIIVLIIATIVLAITVYT